MILQGVSRVEKRRGGVLSSCAQESCPEGREDQQGSGADDSPFRGLLFSKKGDGCTGLTWAVGRGQSGGFSHTQAEGDGQDRKGKNFPV